MNPQHYDKYIITKSPELVAERKQDIKFYKRRILSLTKDMLTGKYPTNDVKLGFQRYLDSVIAHFKFIDKKDILQEEYADMGITDEIVTVTKLSPEQNPDELIMKHKDNPATLDGFVISKNVAPVRKILPKKKEVNLRDPSLRRKGLKKKNVNNN